MKDPYFADQRKVNKVVRRQLDCQIVAGLGYGNSCIIKQSVSKVLENYESINQFKDKWSQNQNDELTAEQITELIGQEYQGEGISYSDILETASEVHKFLAQEE